MKPVIFIILAALASNPRALAQVVALENVNILPMDRNRILERQTVIIRDGRIAQIGAAARVKAPDGAVRVDASGKFLMPGLAEMHGHLPAPDASRELVEHMLFLYVANGVTTVRGMQGNPSALERRAAVASGNLLGPRLCVAGPPFGGNAKTVDVAEKMVRDQKAAGYDLLKIAEGISPAVYEAIVKTANEVKIDFAGHVPNEVGVRRAIAVRQKSIDHLDNYLEALEADTSPLRGADAQTRARDLPFNVDERKIADLARLTRQAGVWNAPTMALWEVFHNGETGEAIRDSMPEVRYMPRTTVEQWVKSKNALLQPGSNIFMGFGVGSKTGQRVIELRRKILKGLRDAGAGIILGTDSPQTFSVPGFSIHREMQVMASVGFTPFEILQSGTRNVAVYFNSLSETGTVEQGKRADLILLNANPLKDISNVARRAGVVVAGRWIPESEIQQRLEKLAAAAPKM
ncbi:MAG TPA: amidohydrolase family protein [Bryobacteraceae bacterium]|nr:amidohydrolase family protein [Bryobacteraceae bacterium]